MIFKKTNKIIGDNTDVGGFECALQHINYNVKDKKMLISSTEEILLLMLKQNVAHY